MRSRPKRLVKADERFTERQLRFIEQFMIDGNATQAAVRAGFSTKTAQQQGARLLSNVVVSAEIARRRTLLSRRYEISADRVVSEYAKIAFARVTDYTTFGPKGVTARDSKDIDESALDAIAEVKERSGKGSRRCVSIKLHSKTEALHALGKHLGLFVDRHEHEIGERLRDGLTRISARLSPAAQEELVRAIGSELDEAVEPEAIESDEESEGAPPSG